MGRGVRRAEEHSLSSVLLCLPLLFVLALAVAGGTSAAVSVTFTVNSTGDASDADAPNGPWNGVCATSTGVCTLRAAIQESNASDGSKDIPSPSNTLSIAPATELPVITDPVVIDGTTQPGFVDKPIVELRGDALAAGSRGIRILAGDSTVRGLVVNGFSDQIVVGVVGSRRWATASASSATTSAPTSRGPAPPAAMPTASTSSAGVITSSAARTGRPQRHLRKRLRGRIGLNGPGT